MIKLTQNQNKNNLMNERLVRICKTTRPNTQRLFLQNKRVTLPTKTKTLLLQFDLATSSTSTNCIKCRAIVLNRFFFVYYHI
jgi:hypothetical protein